MKNFINEKINKEEYTLVLHLINKYTSEFNQEFLTKIEEAEDLDEIFDLFNEYYNRSLIYCSPTGNPIPVNLYMWEQVGTYYYTESYWKKEEY